MARLLVASAGAALTAAGLLTASAARADGNAILGETFAGNDVTIDAKSTYSVDSTLHHATLRVHTLTIDGVLSANGAGTAGINGMNGPQPGGGAGQMGAGLPGGGAGFLGKGGFGSNIVDAGVCDPAGGADGGDAWITADGGLVGKWGAAGGGSVTEPGGNGGGHLVIWATTIKLNGTIDVSGRSFSDKDAAGGGSGGILEIHAWKLEGSGKILARGGDGAEPHSKPTVSGGGGAGGLVILDLINKTGITPDVSGGKSVGCGDTGAGEDGFVDDTPSRETCFDVDGDGFYPPECNPTKKADDCDDSDPDVHPGAKEVCDSVDNNCNGKTDEGDNLCGAGKVCDKGMCVTEGQKDGGPGGDDAGASPDRIDFEGGCDVSPVASATGFAAGIAALTGLALALRIRRRQRRR